MTVSVATSETALVASAHGTRRKLAVLLVAVFLLLGIYFLPVPPALERGGNIIALTQAGKACLAIMAFAVTLWVTETLPFAATSLLVVLLIPASASPSFNAVVAAGFGRRSSCSSSAC